MQLSHLLAQPATFGPSSAKIPVQFLRATRCDWWGIIWNSYVVVDGVAFSSAIRRSPGLTCQDVSNRRNNRLAGAWRDLDWRAHSPAVRNFGLNATMSHIEELPEGEEFDIFEGEGFDKPANNKIVSKSK